MKERPILFSASMVRAILDGSKTQTRRIVKTQPVRRRDIGVSDSELAWQLSPSSFIICPNTRAPEDFEKRSPYGKPGDRLWVRETWAPHPDFPELTCRAIYRADRECEYDTDRWRPSIHMPRWASRIMLEVTGVRVERLNHCSEADAIAEGIEGCEVVINGRAQGKTWRDYSVKCDDPCEWFGSPINSYRSLWEQINGAGSWDANPWVWVIEFRRIK